jgi:hypothetical protein
MAKTVPQTNDNGKILGYMIFCPACLCGHLFYTNHNNPKCNWTFDGNTEKPTFSPSMLVKAQNYPSGNNWPTDEELLKMKAGEKLNMIPTICHSFVRNGQIQFLSDCTHKMAGQTVDLPKI